MATISRSRSPAPNIARSTTSPPVPYSPSLTGPGTSVSSARTSLELPTPTSIPTGTSSNAPAQRRNRAALRDYYNLKAKAQGAGPGTLIRKDSTASNISISTTASTTAATEPAAQGSILPHEIDDQSFNAERYVRTLLEDASLRDILALESTLVYEIRNLDGERKALVYDNYSKLIKAVGTIAEMQKGMDAGTRGVKREANDSLIPVLKIQGQSQHSGGIPNGIDKSDASAGGDLDNVEHLQSKLERLIADMRRFGVANSPAQEAENQRQKTRQRSERQVRRNKQLVRWVLEAPDRLRALVDDDKKDDAEAEWLLVQKYLDRWEGVAGVEHVRSKCAAIMDVQSAQAPADDDDDGNEEEQEEGQGNSSSSESHEEGDGGG